MNNSKNKRFTKVKLIEISFHTKKNRKHDNIETHYFEFVQSHSKIVLYHQSRKKIQIFIFLLFFFFRFENNEKSAS